MPSCDTCALLKVPESPDHARNYRVCTWQPSALPEPVLHLEREALKSISSGRWVTKEWLMKTSSNIDAQRQKVVDCFNARGYKGLT
jgi:hypothetical protein